MDLMPVADADHDSDQIVDFPSCALMTTMVIVRLAILTMIDDGEEEGIVFRT